ncbi:MAG TPA: A/G-specific adenine glycosylase, partial [Polyangiaceae bacterium]|nr:A/G-specific adenine glycosylase [Polyangiaceae bacterium]
MSLSKSARRASAAEKTFDRLPWPEEARRWAELLLAWFDRNRRPLPWREQPTPYQVWVSEIMLQQTRVETVKDYYRRWMSRFPDVESLAAAEESEVLRLWQGLGYYSRARRLLEGARYLV